jgi:hypothetical protein
MGRAIVWYDNDGSGGFRARAIISAGDGPRSVFAADVDGDGDLDVLSASHFDDQIAWHENDGAGGFTAHTISTAADGARSVFAADVDGDGDIDVLSASRYDDKIAWYENDGSQRFVPHTISTANRLPYSVYAADVDGDGDIDVLSASFADDEIAWYENDGSEDFTAHTISTAADGAQSVFAADMDGDGDLDVLSASFDDDKIAWYENDGSGEFTAHTISTAADGARSVFAADVDGDGDLDVLSASFTDDKIAWYENFKALDFGDAPAPYPTVRADDGARHEPAGPRLGAARDEEVEGQPSLAANGDGADEDGVTLGSIRVGELDVIFNVNVQNAPAGAKLDAWIDFDRDGTWDGPGERIAGSILVEGVHSIEFDVPSGARTGDTYARFRLSTAGTNSPTGLANDGEVEDYQVTILRPPLPVADLGDAPAPYPTTWADDGARHTDVGPTLGATRDKELEGQSSILANGDGADEDGVAFGSMRVGQLDGSVIVNVGSAPAGAKLDGWIDFNRDGTWGGPGEQVFDGMTVVDGDNALRFDVPSWARSGNTYARLRLSTAGDLGVGGLATDGEVEDYLVTIDPPVVADSVFVGESTISTATNGAISVFAVDVDGDGDMDVLSASWNDDKIVWYENNGRQRFVAHTIRTGADGAVSVFAADIDGDGDIDVLSASLHDDEIAWYENDGSEQFTAHTISTAADGARSVFAADVDGDGDIDVLSASKDDDKIAWYENDGSEGFTAHTISTDADGAYSVFAADVDGDGDLDVLSASRFDDKIAWYENDGIGGFTSHTISTSPNGARSVFAADIDGDGDIDVLSAAVRDDEIAWYENDGSENFTAHEISGTADGAFSVFAADVDGDGDLDVLSASYRNDEIAWYENHGNKTFTTHSISTTADKARGVFAADMDGDGDLDVLSASENDDKIAWYENVNGMDFGDAPAYYRTVRADDGARHEPTGPTLGTARDEEFDGQPSLAADGDGADEDGVTFGPLRIGQLGANVNVHVQNAPNGARLDAWIDFDGDGTWGDANEQIASSLFVVEGANTIDFGVPGGARSGNTYARFRISTTGNLGPDGAAANGEVEDYRVTILAPEFPVADLGDAPAPYPTTWADDGARHADVGPTLGAMRDKELEGQPSLAADLDDDDGVTFGSIRVGQLDATVVVNVQSAPAGAKLDAWIDFNSDGSWGGPGEHVFDRAPVNNGDNALLFDVPSWAVDGATYARFRLSTAGNLGEDGWAADGEVEDYLLTIDPPVAATGTFFMQNTFEAASRGVSSVFAADVDGDGDLDAISASYRDNNIAWYENDGSQRFTLHVVSTTADWAKSVFAEDVDGDGDIDVLSASYRDDKIVWYENDGNGVFTAHTISTVADGAMSVFAADVDGDGDTDVLSASRLDDKIAWYENDGNANFTAHTISVAADGARSVFAADVDGDGDLDVLSASSSDGKIAWYENDGGQRFTERAIIAVTNADGSVFAADFDGDGDTDVLSASLSNNNVVWYENDGSQQFTPRVISAAAEGADSMFAADVDGDGDLDVLSAFSRDGTITWYKNDGSGGFTAHIISSFASRSIFAADMDGDGRIDVLSGSAGDGKIAWFKLLSGLDFGDAPAPYSTKLDANGAVHGEGGPQLGATRDSEDDGQPSAAADGDGSDEDGVTFGSIRVGQLDASVVVNVQNAPAGARLDAWIDFNGDGSWGGPGEQIFDNTSLVDGDNFLQFDVPSWAADGPTYSRFRLSSVGDLGTNGAAADGEVEDYRVTIDPPASAFGVFLGQNTIADNADGARSVSVADVDGDGDVDVIGVSYLDRTIAWYKNDGSGGFVSHTIDSEAYGVSSVFATDVDGDGDTDVLSGSYSDRRIAWYENDGSENFTAHLVFSGARPRSVIGADMDGDGDIDVLSASSNEIAWYENDGGEAFTAHIITLARNALSVFAADVDGDGDIDVLGTSLFDDEIAWYENDGSQRFTARTISTDAIGARSVFAADVDGDGDIDVLIASDSDDRIAWYENDGSEGFTAHTISNNAAGAESVFVADVDGDGDLDVLSASSDDDTIAWYENDGSQRFTAHNISTDADGVGVVLVADADGDGDLDVFSSSFADDTIAWYENANPVPYPLLMAPLAPAGGIVYEISARRSIETAGAADTLQVDLDAGQFVTFVVDPFGGLQAAVELRDSGGNLVGAAGAAAPGETLVLRNLPIVEAGTYTMGVTGIGETTGQFFIGRLLLNADVENEAHGGSSNDDLATAQDIEPAMLPLGDDSAERGAVLGSNVGSDDWYRFALADRQSATMALSRLSSGSSTVELYDAAGNRLAMALVDGDGIAHIGEFLDTTGDGLPAEYFLRVFGDAEEYNLVVTRGARLAVGDAGATLDLTLTGTALGHLDDRVGSREFSVGVTAGDVLEISTSTPAGGAGEFVNLLNPRVELYDPTRTLVAGDDDSAADGRNASFTHTADRSGSYTVRILPEGESTGEFALNIAGHSGLPSAFSITSTNPADGGVATTNPVTVIVDFSDTLLITSLDAADLTIDGVPATSVDVVDHNSVQFFFDEVLAPGQYNVNIAAGSMTDLQGTDVESLSSTLTVPRTVSGTLTDDLTLAGEWRVSEDLIVPAGTTLTIEPGTQLVFDPGVEVIVNGRIVAIGTPQQRIRLIGGGDGVTWDGIHVISSTEDNVFAYVDIDGAQSISGSIGSFSSVLTIDNVTFSGSRRHYVRTSNASVVIRNSIFPDRFGPDEKPGVGDDNTVEMINGSGIMAGGQMIIEGNTFGTNKGHNDIIDFTGPVRPGPILQVLNNVFMGGSDEMLDLGGDAYIEGNIFMHARRDASNTSSSHTNVISTGDGSFGATIVAVRNVFYDIEHVIDLEDSDLAILEHNTIVGIPPDGADPGNGSFQEYSAVNLVIVNRSSPGRGAHLEGNIIVDVPERIFGEPDTTRNGTLGPLSDLVVNNTLLPSERCGDVIGERAGTIMDLGMNILCGDAMLADVAGGDFSLLPGSPAIGAGVHGLDLGALVPAGATVSDVPAGAEDGSAEFTVDGPGIFEYRFRLDGGPWGDAASVDDPIELTDVSDGPHRLEVVGMNYAGVWQDDGDAVVRTWTVGPPAIPADLTGNGFVDFADLTLLLANWGKMVSAAEGNIVGPGSAVDFADLTLLLAAWTGSGAADSPQPAAAKATVRRDTAAAERHIASDDHFDRLGRRDRAAARRADHANGLRPHVSSLRRLQAVAVDKAMIEESTRDQERIIRGRTASGARR